MVARNSPFFRLSPFARMGVVLGLLTAIGPLGIDLYLPALPVIASDLQSSQQGAQASLLAFFATMGLCQVVYGPVSDMVGRKAPLYFGISLYVVAAIGCALAPNAAVLVALRAVQGVGACGCFLVPRAIVRDLHTGHEAVRLMAMLMLVFSVVPILAPLAGSGIVALSGWRGTFWVMAGLGLVALVLLHFALPETRPAEERQKSGFASALAGYKHLLGDREFLSIVMIGAFGMSSFFTYLSNASFVMIEHFGLSPMQFSVAFALNAIGFIGASQFASRLGKIHGTARVVRGAITICAAIMATHALVVAAGVDRFEVLIPFLFCGFACLGLVVPNSSVLALEKHGPIAGTAAALMGTLQMATGAFIGTASALLADGTARTMVFAIAAATAAASLIAWRALDVATGPARQPHVAE